MHKETFRFKQSQYEGDVNLPPHVPHEREVDEESLRQDILTLMAGTMILISGLLNLWYIIYIIIGHKSNITIVLANDNFLKPCCITVLVAVVFGFISMILHFLTLNNTKTTSLYPLLIIFSGTTILIVAGGSSLAVICRSKMQFDRITDVQHFGDEERVPSVDVVLRDSVFKEEMISYLEKQLKVYDTNKNNEDWLDSVQNKLKCCGIENNYIDWLQIRGTIPKSCCPEGVQCTEAVTHKSGCLDAIAMELANGASRVAGFGFILMTVMIYSLVVSGLLYVRRGKRMRTVDVLSEKDLRVSETNSSITTVEQMIVFENKLNEDNSSESLAETSSMRDMLENVISRLQKKKDGKEIRNRSTSSSL